MGVTNSCLIDDALDDLPAGGGSGIGPMDTQVQTGVQAGTGQVVIFFPEA